jgi:hypothetical protein
MESSRADSRVGRFKYTDGLDTDSVSVISILKAECTWTVRHSSYSEKILLNSSPAKATKHFYLLLYLNFNTVN